MRRLLTLAICALLPRTADACAPAPPTGAEVIVAAEEAIIVWDAPRKTEHFIRRAQFESSAPEFGFLVPTPTSPTLAEADDHAFARLREATREAIVHETRVEPSFSCLSTMKRSAAPAQAPAVTVVSIAHVSGYEAAVLQATDASALQKWLASNGYDARPELTAWMAPYVASKWTITAFKVAGASDAGPTRPATAAVRMTFTTDSPVFPYREPSDQAKHRYPERLLRVFLIANERLSGTVGAFGAWSAELRYAKPTAVAPLLASALPTELIPASAWLHDFVDRSTPRAGTDDLFFARSADQTEVTPAPLVAVSHRDLYVPLDAAALLAVAAYIVVRARRRR